MDLEDAREDPGYRVQEDPENCMVYVDGVLPLVNIDALNRVFLVGVMDTLQNMTTVAGDPLEFARRVWGDSTNPQFIDQLKKCLGLCLTIQEACRAGRTGLNDDSVRWVSSTNIMVARRVNEVWRMVAAINAWAAPSEQTFIQSHERSGISGIIASSANTPDEIIQLYRETIERLARFGARKSHLPGGEVGVFFPYYHRNVFTYTYVQKNNQYGRPMFIRDFIAEIASHDHDYQAKLFNSPGYTARLAEMIRDLHHPLFDVLKTCKTQWSFRNGVFDSRTCEFYPYGSHDIQILDKSVSSVQFMDMDMEVDAYRREMDDAGGDPMGIRTPYCDRIGITQNWSAAIMRFWYALVFGRSFGPLTSADQQFCAMHIGRAGTGKSMVLKILSKYYVQHVREFSVPPRQNFELMDLWDGLIAVCYESSGFAYPKELFLSMASCEPVSVSVMRDKSIRMHWTAPLVFAGNSTPPFNDHDIGGALARRQLIFEFMQHVGNSDPRLEEMICSHELARIMYKGSMLYKRYYMDSVGKDVWDCVPREFHEVRLKYRAKGNPMLAFITSEIFEIGAHMRMPVAEFSAQLTRWCNENGVKLDPKKLQGVCELNYIHKIIPNPNDPNAPREPYLQGIGLRN